MAALTDIEQPGAERAFAAWLYRIARHRLQPGWRSRRQHPFVSLEELAEQAAPVLPIDPAVDLAEVFGRQELVACALAPLSQSLREALVLNILDGFSATEAAAILGISRDAAERRISRAKEQFRASYRALTGERD